MLSLSTSSGARGRRHQQRTESAANSHRAPDELASRMVANRSRTDREIHTPASTAAHDQHFSDSQGSRTEFRQLTLLEFDLLLIHNQNLARRRRPMVNNKCTNSLNKTGEKSCLSSLSQNGCFLFNSPLVLAADNAEPQLL